MERPVNTSAPAASDSSRKDRNMKRIIALGLFALALSFSAVFANPYVHVDDTGVDYDNTDLEEAYLAWGMDEGNLIVTLADAPFEGALPAIRFFVHDYVDRTDFWGEKFNADMSDIADIRWIGVNDYDPR